jgi:hypothetical protein
MSIRICPFCLNDVPFDEEWTESTFGCPHCSRLVVLHEALHPPRHSGWVALAAGFVGATVAIIDFILTVDALGPPPQNPRDKPWESNFLFLNMWVVFFGVTSAVGQLLYRATGERGGEELVRRGLGRVAPYLDAYCCVWLLGWGIHALWTGRGVDPSLVLGLVLLVPAAFSWRRYLRSPRSRLKTSSFTILTELLETARQEAVGSAQDYVASQHLLLAIARLTELPVGQLLTARGASERRLRTVLAPHLVPAPGGPVPVPPFAPIVWRIVERAVSNIEAHGDELTKPEHLLKAILIEPDCLATNALVDLGIDLKQLKKALSRRIKSLRPADDET